MIKIKNNVKPGRAEGKTSAKQVFTLTGTDARTVQLVGDFTEWQKHPIPLQKDSTGVWHAAVELRPGPHRYRFLVDGQWQDDPAWSRRVANPYGSQDCLRQVA